jgi:hypothetical protein
MTDITDAGIPIISIEINGASINMDIIVRYNSQNGRNKRLDHVSPEY